MTVVVWVCGLLVAAAAVLAVIRAERGPSMLDRTVALDIFVTTMIAAVALYAARERRADVVPILVVLSLVGFVGSVTIARFASAEPEAERRVRTREEVAAEDAERLARERAEDLAARAGAAAQGRAVDAGGGERQDGERQDDERQDPTGRGLADGDSADGDSADGDRGADPAAGDDEHHGGPAIGEVR
ncbi:monovalent cation/H+ antiporter complex subunit F [Cellulomonas sp. HZM]|uniref:monovalent cation/H+ antiporter complex subunit F n=1 Tax=Cellulomonas sp. HZM TaxID=1454010 RepID=UPI0004934398|nr:MrpF/PhaF family protein [Cellulomonas sp. HZM]